MKDEEVIRIFHAAYPNAKTRDNYIQRIEKLKAQLSVPTIVEALADPDAHYPTLASLYPNVSTRKNFMTAILALFKHSEGLRAAVGPDRVKRWKKFHDDMDSFQEASYKKNMPSNRQLSKYTSTEDMSKKYLELRKAPDAHNTLQSSQWLVFLSLCVALPPKRADYGSMRIYVDKDPNLKGENYLVLRTKAPVHAASSPSYLVFTAYKTASEYQRVDEALPPQVARDIKDSLRRHPRSYLFVNRYGKPFATNNAFSKYVIRMFETLFGRATGVTMLRHIFITEKVDFNELNDEELEDISKQMMHSTGLQRKYNWNKAKVCGKLRTEADVARKELERAEAAASNMKC